MILQQIKLLLTLHDLQHNRVLTPPGNRGASLVCYHLLLQAMTRSLSKIKTRKLSSKNEIFWLKLLKDNRGELELSSLFFHPDAPQILYRALLMFLLLNSCRKEEFCMEYLQESAHVRVALIQHHINELQTYGIGHCLHYNSLALYFLLENKIAPVGSLWLHKKNSAEGHNILVIGLTDESDYYRLPETNALIFDFWTGKTYSAKRAFEPEQPLANYHARGIQICYHQHETGENPFYYKEKISCEAINPEIERLCGILLRQLSARKEHGERVVSPQSTFSHSRDGEIHTAINDLDDEERTHALQASLQQLNRYQSSAVIIQRRWRFFKANNTTEFFMHKEAEQIDPMAIESSF